MSQSSEPEDPMLGLLERWRAGDRQALDQLLTEVLPWLQAEVRRSLGNRRDGQLESGDLLNAAILNFLTWGPRFVPRSGAQLRSLLKRIATNVLIDERRRSSHAGRHLDSLLPSNPSLSGFGPQVPSEHDALRVVSRDEDASWVRLALQFLDPDDRYLLLASEVENQEWATIARELGMPSADAARVRGARLKPKVGNLLRKLKSGQDPQD